MTSPSMKEEQRSGALVTNGADSRGYHAVVQERNPAFDVLCPWVLGVWPTCATYVGV